MIKLKIIQYLKPDIRDPEGGEVKKTLNRLGYPVTEFHIGREMTLTVDVNDEDEAVTMCKEMCDRLLLNPILHRYEISVL